MRKYIILFALLLTALTGFSTGQITEHINDNGVDKKLCSLLLEQDTLTYSILKRRIPERLSTTALRRNYIGYWKIKNDSLFHDYITVPNENCKEEKYTRVKIEDLYPSKYTDSGYFADWVNDTLRIVSGNVINYIHSGWMQTWEHEELVAVEKGIIKGRTPFDNRIVYTGHSDTEIREMYKKLDFGKIPERMVISLGYATFDAEGKPSTCNIRVIKSCGDKSIDEHVVKVIEEWMLTCLPLPVYYIRGKYKSDKTLLLNLPVI